MNSPLLSRRLRVALLPLLLLAAGCARDTNSPTALGYSPHALAPEIELDAPPQGFGFVDLADDRRSTLAGQAWVSLDGGPTELVDEWIEVRAITGDRVIDGVTYRIEDRDGFEALFRQDRSGLYLWQKDAGPFGRRTIAAAPARRTIDAAVFERAIVAGTSSAAEADAYRRVARVLVARLAALQAGPPGGVGASEITFLRYPLRPGASWVGRENFNVWTVEGHDQLDTAAGRIAAWRMNIVLPAFFGPDDRFQTWWGVPGEVRESSYIEGEVTDAKGNVIGTIAVTGEVILTEYVPGN